MSNHFVCLSVVINLITFSICHAMLSRARYCYGELSVGVCLSVTLRYRDHIAWNISKIISQLVNWVVTLYWPDIMDLFKGNRPKFWLELDGMWKKWLLAFKSSNISEARQERNKVTVENR